MLESAVQGWLRRLSARYRGSPWRLLSLSNGGLYFAPEVSSPVSLHWSGNGFRGDVSADAAGIVATLFALSTMAHADGDEVLDRLYFLLREHAFAHRERKSIIRAVD